MKTLTVIYRESRKGSLKHLERDFSSKKAFAEMARLNGYRVITVLTQEEIVAYSRMTETEAIYGRCELIREYCQQVLY